MTEWRTNWQNKFLNKEIKEHNLILEFQHSKISIKEVNAYNKKIIWIIDGNNSIKVTKLNNCDRVYLEFKMHTWKYESFISYDIIFIDINESIYKIYPKYVKSNMIDVDKPFDKETFIELLNNNDKQLNIINIPKQSNLYIKQQGAGNAKTYGLIQMLESKELNIMNILL